MREESVCVFLLFASYSAQSTKYLLAETYEIMKEYPEYPEIWVENAEDPLQRQQRNKKTLTYTSSL